MRLLVTRPVADAQALTAKLEARGHSVICAPVIEIVTKPDAAPELTNVKGLAFTSANGVRAFGQNITGELLRKRRGVKLFRPFLDFVS